jgi:immune inhibitor A
MSRPLDRDRHASSAGEGTEAGPSPVAPSPQLRKKLREVRQELRTRGATPASALLTFRQPRLLGMNDGMIVPPDQFPLGTSSARLRRAAAERAPLRGVIRVAIVLVDFSDKKMKRSKAEFEKLFFSQGSLPNGSVREYYSDVSGGLIDIQGEVVGPYRLPRKMTEYAHGKGGMIVATPNAGTMARDAAKAANKDIDFSRYDNDGDKYVDAFIVIHAGHDAAESGDMNDIWAHKWVLSGSELPADGVKVYAYLTVAEDCKIGVCAHELGHLLFGWPDLYDTDDSSFGLGDWCLMAGGSWNGNQGDNPAHPSAWCKQEQGWVTVTNVTKKQKVSVHDVKSKRKVYRLWKKGASGKEFFLVENRQQKGYDTDIPSNGLLVYHIDDALDSNSDETHYKVGLLQADGLAELEAGTSQGDAGDPFPGSSDIREITGATTPSTRSFAGLDTSVAIRSIGASADPMSVEFDVAATSGATDPVLKRGSKGAAVLRLQKALLALGFNPGPLDGDFGSRTEKAVKAYQTARGLDPDGIVGPLTWASIHADGE